MRHLYFGCGYGDQVQEKVMPNWWPEAWTIPGEIVLGGEKQVRAVAASFFPELARYIKSVECSNRYNHNSTPWEVWRVTVDTRHLYPEPMSDLTMVILIDVREAHFEEIVGATANG